MLFSLLRDAGVSAGYTQNSVYYLDPIGSIAPPAPLQERAVCTGSPSPQGEGRMVQVHNPGPLPEERVILQLSPDPVTSG